MLDLQYPQFLLSLVRRTEEGDLPDMVLPQMEMRTPEQVREVMANSGYGLSVLHRHMGNGVYVPTTVYVLPLGEIQVIELGQPESPQGGTGRER